MRRKDLKKSLTCGNILSGKKSKCRKKADKERLPCETGRHSARRSFELGFPEKFLKEKNTMRNLKKFLALVLATLMVVSAAATVSAYSDVADDSVYAEAIAALTEYGIVNGTNAELDTFSPDDDVVRFQMALMMARALEPDTTDWENGMAIFEDVTEWYGAIAYAYMNGIVTGMDATHFEPKSGIRCQDALIMAVRALGYDVDTTLTPYWIGAYQTAAKIGLTANLQVTDPAKTLTRAETAQVIYNMLKATPADGGATIEAKNFGAATAENTTTFVLTATENQAYLQNGTTEAGYVGIQTLVNGIPSGDIVYVPAELLGIDADDVDDYFGYAFDLVNFDAKTNKFDKAIMGAEPVVVYNADVTVSGSKISYNGVTYVAGDSITGAALRNEIVIFNGGKLANAAKMLLTDKDGNIVNYNREVLATFAYETATGAKYYAYEDVTTGKATVISEAVALEKFGVAVDNDSYVEYQTLTAEDLNGNYQITFFDDDRDGKFERAIVTEVYLSAFKGQSSGKETFGPMAGEKNVTYTEKLSKGNLFTYTYNEQTKVVTVLDVIEAQTGTLTRVNTTKNNGDGKYAVVVTIDGVQYTLGNAAREAAGLTSAKIYDKAEGSFDKVADAAVNYYYDAVSSIAAGLTVGSPIKFYALDNGTLITAKSYSIEEAFEYVVLDEIVSYDDENAYVDLYINGKLNEDVAVSKIDGKTLADLTIFQLSKLLADEDLFATGNVFRAVKLADGSYQLSEILDTTDADSVKAFKLATRNYDDKLVFDAGIADNEGVARADMLRTKDSTVFYFLKTNNKGEVVGITTYVGAPNNSSIDFSDDDVELYADKIGYTGDNKGVAAIVFVYYKDSSDIKGFGVANVEYNTAYIFDGAMNYTYASANDLGLTASEYAGKYFYEYSVAAINMADGAKITTVYSEKPLSAKQFVTISADNVVISTDVKVESAKLNSNDFVQNRYYIIDDGDVVAKDDKITTVKLTKIGSYDVKTDNIGAVLGTTDSVVYFIEDYEDGVFVGVVEAIAAVKEDDGTATVKTNAKYVSDGVAKAGNFSYEVKDGKLTGTLTITDAEFKGWDETVTGKKVNFVNTLGDTVVSYSIDSITVNGDKATESYDFAAAANADGDLVVTMNTTRVDYNDTTDLAKGTYNVVIKNSVNSDTYTINFTVA